MAAEVDDRILVFVIDDDRELRESVAEVLMLEGYRVRTMPSADAAWTELALGFVPAAILLDLWLPGTTSGEFLRRLRASRHAGVPVILLSASRSSSRLELDVEAICEKSGEPTAIVRAVDRVVGRAPASATSFRVPARRAIDRRSGHARRRVPAAR